MNEIDLMALLESGETVRLTEAERESVVALTETVELRGVRVPFGPVLVRIHGRLAALERATPDSWALRPLAGEEEAMAFLERRREGIDRMWDGCGCRIDAFD